MIRKPSWLWSAWSIGAIAAVALAALAVGACASQPGGTDSNTNWLNTCATDTDCTGGLTCECGQCTAACKLVSECPTMNAVCRPAAERAECGPSASGSYCAAACNTSSDCPSDLGCVAGWCGTGGGSVKDTSKQSRSSSVDGGADSSDRVGNTFRGSIPDSGAPVRDSGDAEARVPSQDGAPRRARVDGGDGGYSGPLCNENGYCDGLESAAACPNECACNHNGACNSSETPATCPSDCLCDYNGNCDLFETQANCPNDCGYVCNYNGICEGQEDPGNCSDECSCNNDGACDATENPTVCPKDCK